METLYQGGMSIKASDLPQFFTDVQTQYPGQLGQWEEEAEGHGLEYILPNGVKLSNALGKKWLEFNGISQ